MTTRASRESAWRPWPGRGVALELTVCDPCRKKKKTKATAKRVEEEEEEEVDPEVGKSCSLLLWMLDGS